MAAFGGYCAFSGSYHSCGTGCPTVCGAAYGNVDRNSTSTLIYVSPPAPKPLLKLSAVVPRFPEDVRAAPADPVRLPGVRLGIRWREYHTRR